MKQTTKETLNGYRTLEAFVDGKINKLANSPKTYSDLYKLMFSEGENVMYERSSGYRIERLTYAQSRARVEQKASALKERLKFLKEGSIVGIYMQNGPEWIEFFWAILRCSFRPLLINMRLPEAVVCACLNSCNVAAVVSDGKIFPRETVLSADIAGAVLPSLPQDAPFGSEIFFMSSGTSQNVKICAYTVQSLCVQLYDSAKIIKSCSQIKKHYNGRLKLLDVLPFYHIFGFCATYMWFAFFSRTMVHLRDLSPDTLLNTIKRHGVTHIFAVPLFWQKIYSRAVMTIKGRGDKTYKKFLRGLKISNGLKGFAGNLFARKAFKEVRENLFGESVQFMISGGSMLPAEVSAFFNGIGYPLVNGYGMTETGITGAELSGKRKNILSLSVGRPFSSVSYKIEGGVLYVKGGSIADYVMENGEVRTLDKSQWFCTNDLAECRGGRYFICGRADELVVGASGENLNPNAIEPLFMADGVREVCLIKQNSSPVLVVSLNPYLSRDGACAVRDKLKDIAALNALSEQIGRMVFVADPLICGDEFKLNRRRISADLSAGRIALYDFESAINPDEYTPVQKKVAMLFAAALNRDCDKVGFKTDFFADEGGTSLDYFSLASAVRTEFGVDILAENSRSLKSVKDVSDYVEGRIK